MNKRNLLRTTFRTLIAATISLYLLILVAVKFDPIQSRLTKALCEALTEMVGSKVSIGQLEVGLFNRVIVNDLVILDQRQDTLLQAGRATAKIELRSLFRRQLSLRSVSLLDARVKLYRPKPDAPANYQFLIDAFSSSGKKKSTLNLRINSIILRRVDIHYDALYRPATPGRFNPSHWSVLKLNGNISLKEISPNRLHLRVRTLSFTERSGFALRKLSFKLDATPTHALIEDFDLTLPDSYLRFPTLRASYDSRRGIKYLIPTLDLHTDISAAQVALSDLRPFMKLPAGTALPGARLHAHLSVTRGQFRLQRLRLQTIDRLLSFEGDALCSMSGNTLHNLRLQRGRLRATSESAVQLVSLFTDKPAILAPLSRLGYIEANIDGHYLYDSRHGTRAQAALQLQTAVGLVSADGVWNDGRLRTTLHLTQAQPAHLMGNPKLPEQVSLTGHADLTLRDKHIVNATGDIDLSHLVWAGKHLQQIRLTADYQGHRLRAGLTGKDSSADLSLTGEATLIDRRIEALAVRGNIHQFIPTDFGLHHPYGTATFAGDIDLALTGLTDRRPYGHLRLDNFRMSGSPRGDYALDHLLTTLSPAATGSRLEVVSDFADLRLTGALDSGHFMGGIESLCRRALPGLWPQQSAQRPYAGTWSIEGTLCDNDFLRKVAKTELTLPSPVFMQGTLDSGEGRTSIQVHTDSLQYGTQHFGRSSLSLTGQGTNYDLLVQTHKVIKDKDFTLVTRLTAAEHQLQTSVSWRAQSEHRYEGSLVTSTTFEASPDGHAGFDMHIHPGHFILSDTLWHINTGRLSLRDRCLSMKNVSIHNQAQSLTIEGAFSPTHHDSIVADIRNIDIDYILALVNFKAVEFGGRATGRAVFTLPEGKPLVQAQIHVPQFYFNGTNMGPTDIAGSWSRHDNRIRLDALMNHDLTHNRTTRVEGYVDLAQKGLLLDINAHGTNLGFLQHYMNGIFSDFSGSATGQVRLMGPFKQLDFEGEVKSEAQFKIDMTGVEYHLRDGRVTFSPGEFAFHDFTIDDGRHGTGRARGTLRHQHLKDLTYNFGIEAHHLLCYDKGETPDLPFYSSTTGSGNVLLRGRPGYFTADITLDAESPSTLTYNLGSPETAQDGGSLFRIRDGSLRHTTSPKPEAGTPATTRASGSTDVTLNMLINVTPQTRIKVITDPHSGDAITAWGEGAIRATWSNKGGFDMYGTYTLDRGDYKLSLQNFIRKDLTIRKGSTITFTGPPLLADLDIHAAYTINGVSLSDLNYSSGFSGKTARVDCLLNITGKAKSPQVNFDLDLSGISDDEKQMVRQLITTDEDMNRQVIYLLGIGRFYTAGVQGASTVSSQQQSSAAMRSFLSSTMTGQLNAVINSALGSRAQNWSFGTNVMPGTVGWNDLEVDGTLQGRLFNDRLLINGNFGYRDHPTYTSNFIGDFDIQYLLTPRGTVKLRAYSETTDRYFTKSALTTQGVGISFERDFNNLIDLFRRNKVLNRQRAAASPTPVGTDSLHRRGRNVPRGEK